MKPSTILITNDDGFNAPGIYHLNQALKKDYNTVLVAPDRERSAVGHGITVFSKLLVKKIAQNTFIVNGTPADCTRTGLAGLFDFSIDLVISGINYGPNLGWDIFYSGTVAGAREAVMKHKPGIAISIDTWSTEQKLGMDPIPEKYIHWESAEYYINVVLNLLSDFHIPDGTYLNVNIPNLELSKIRGILATKMGVRYYKEKIAKIDKEHEWTEVQFDWNPTMEMEAGTDMWAISEGYVSITPLSLDTNDNITKELINKLNAIVD